MNLTAKKEMNEDQREFIDKWLMILFALDNFKPIKGRTRLVKEFFLIWRNFFYHLDNIAEFFPYHFGPYSTLLAVRVNDLFHQKSIDFKESGQEILYGLSKNEKEKALAFIKKEDPRMISEITKWKIKYAKSSIGKLLGDIYRKYPEFSKYSLVSEESTIKGKFPKAVSQVELTNDGVGFVKSSKFDEDFKVSKKYLKRVIEKLQK